MAGGAAPGGPGGEGGVRRDVAVYILARLVVGIGLVAVTVASLVRGRGFGGVEYGIAAVLFGAMGVSAALLPRAGRHPGFVWAQLGIDALFASSLVYATGGPASPYFPLYFMNVVAAAWLLPPRGPVVVAAVDAVAFGGVLLLLGEEQVAHSFGNNRLLAYTQVLLNVFGFFLVGGLSGLLSGQLRAARARLAGEVEQRERLQEQQRTILENLDSAVLLVDDDGVVRGGNPAAFRLLGAVSDRPLSEVLRVRGRSWEEQVELGGRLRHLLCSRSALPGGGEVVLVEDITVLRQMEAAMAREERLAAVGRLAAAMAHEIRNPLASLSGSLQLLAQDGGSPLHGIMEREVRRLNDLVEQFLAAARPLEVQPRPVDARAIAREVLEAFGNDPRFHDRRRVFRADDDLPPVPLDPDAFRQALWNLVLNAGQATRPGGRVEVALAVEGDGFVVEVGDDGAGIPADQLDRIFDPFHTTRSGGTGLGLANVERVVRAHGGVVGVRSEPGEGTVFRLRFPLEVQEDSGNGRQA